MSSGCRAQKGRLERRGLMRSAYTGLALSVTLGLLITPNAGAVPMVTHILVAPYKGTVASSSSNPSFNGCAYEKTSVAKWAASTGSVFASGLAFSKTCKSLAGVGGGGGSSTGTSINVAIPFRVSSPGNHTISTTWTVSIGSTLASTSSGCPSKNVNYHPKANQYSSGVCMSGGSISLVVNAYLVDLNNSSWSSFNRTSLYAYNYSAWQNYTFCYNYGTGPGCYNNTAFYNNSFVNAQNVAGLTSFSWNGVSTFTLYSNATGMLAKHRYAIVVGVGVGTFSFAEAINLLAPWAANATGALNLATLGHSAKLNSMIIS